MLRNLQAKPLTGTLALASLALWLAACSAAPLTQSSGVVGSTQDWVLRSPDGALNVSVGVGADGRLAYAVSRQGKQVLAPSPLGLTVDGVDLGQGAKVAGEPAVRELDETYALLGNHPTARNHAFETVIPLETAGKKFSLVVRAYDDGIAVRYLLPAGAKRIDGEATGWRVPAGAAQVAYADASTCYEGLSHVKALAQVPEGKTLMAPVTVQAGDCYLSFAEADCENFSDMALVRQGDVFKAQFYAEPKGWDISRRADEARPGVRDGTYLGQAASPWRSVVVAKDLTALVNSDLLMNLCPAPAAGMDFSWVKPGRCLWQWWSVGAPKYEDQKAWYDAAAKLKWEYYLIDDGWRTWRANGKNQWELLAEVIAYGKHVGVKSLVWVNSAEMRNAKGRRAYLEKVKACGADGIKIDFIPDGSASTMQWYMGAMQDCAELKLALNFHGSVKPTGLRRTYPNDITREAVRGNEWHMSRYHRIAPKEMDVSQPFTRCLAGPADVTPVMMDPKELKSGNYTWAHEFAQAMVVLSPVTHFCDQYKFYVGNPMQDLFQDIPTVWDETRVLSCTEMGQVVGFARRKGGVWWVGVMNGAGAREVKIPLDFLGKATHGTLIYDDATTDAAVDRREQQVSPSETLTLKLRPAGGFLGRFGPAIKP